MIDRRRFALGLAWMTTCLSLAAEPAGAEKSLSDQLPRVAAKEPAEALKSFEILHGFQMVLVAREPDVVDPVDAAFDEAGRLWVVEMRGYPYPEKGPKLGRVRRLTDNDADGVFDQSVVVADGLPWVTGIALYKQGCFVIAPPDLWYFKDESGDGIADVKERVWTGFETSNVQALANNLKWGLDGRIYGATAGNGGILRRLDDPSVRPVSLQGRDFAFDPATRELEAISGTMQFGQSFNDWYDRFVCGNSNHAMHVVFDDRYLRRDKGLTVPRLLIDIPVEGGAGPVFRRSQPEPWRVVRTARRAESGQSFSTAELHATGYFTSASGVTIYRGSAYPPDYRDNIFVGDVGGNLVHRKTMQESGATFVARRADEGKEFVTSSDNWFRPVNFVNGPDGCLYVLDMYRETIEHPWSIPEDIKSHLDLESGRDRGRIYRLTPPDFARTLTRDMGTLGVDELLPYLAHSNAWHRETAQRLLIERRQTAVVEALRMRLRSGKESTAFGRLHGMAILSILGGLEEEDIITGLKHEAPRLREQSIRWAESRLKSSSVLAEQVLARLEDESFRVRWQAALSVGELPIERRLAGLAKLAAQDGDDPWMRVAILCSSADGPGQMLAELWKVEGADRPELVEGLVLLIGSKRSKEEWVSMMDSLVSRSDSTRRRVLASLAQSAGATESRKLLTESVKERPSEKVLNSTLESSRRLAMDPLGNLGERVRAIESLALDASPDIKEWAGLLDAREPREVQLAALALLGQSSEPQVGRLIVEAWPLTTPSLRSELLEVLLARPDRQKELVEGMEKGVIAGSQLTSSARTRLVSSSDAESAARAKKVLESLSGNRSAIVAKYAEAASSVVDLAVGRKVFERECATCHKLKGVGQEVGPNLATIQGRSPQQLVQNILDPNVEVLPSFVEVSVVLDDGRVASGMVASENANSVTLKRAEGIVQTISRESIESITSTGKSLMPEGLEQKISPAEMTHLIGYLLDATDSSKITGKR